MPTLNKSRYRTHDQIMENLKDELEVEYRNAELRQQADALDEKLSKNPKTYRALLQELAIRELSRQPVITEQEDDHVVH